MNPALLLRCGLSVVLVAWAVLGYGFVRASLQSVRPGVGELVVIVSLSLLLMLPLVWLAPLWSLPDVIRTRRGSRRLARGECPWCGHTLREAAEGVCPECGPLGSRDGPAVSVMVRRCVLVFLGAWILGAVLAEAWSRADETSFRREMEAPGLTRYERARWWPMWGGLQWNPDTDRIEGTSPR